MSTRLERRIQSKQRTLAAERQELAERLGAIDHLLNELSVLLGEGVTSKVDRSAVRRRRTEVVANFLDQRGTAATKEIIEHVQSNVEPPPTRAAIVDVLRHTGQFVSPGYGRWSLRTPSQVESDIRGEPSR